MALIGNYSPFNKNPGRYFGGNSTSVAAGVGQNIPQLPSNWKNSGSRRNFILIDGNTTVPEYVAFPTGYLDTGWMLPVSILTAELSSHYNSQGDASGTGNGAAGKNGLGTSGGSATAVAIGQLIVSGIGSAAGVSSPSGNIVAAIAASGTIAASTTAVTGSMTAKGHTSGTSAGIASPTLVRGALGELIGSIAPAVTLEAAGFSTYLLDSEDVETGLTLREALRLIAAASAGEVSGGGTTTITIRNAVADSKDRIIATVDNDGNRTSITYDLT